MQHHFFRVCFSKVQLEQKYSDVSSFVSVLVYRIHYLVYTQHSGWLLNTNDIRDNFFQNVSLFFRYGVYACNKVSPDTLVLT